MKEMILKLAKEEDGASMVEYVLLLALIAAVLVGGFGLIGTSSKGKLETISTQLGAAK